MGILRVLLALSVVIGHSPGHVPLPLRFLVISDVAVPAFFVISGYYMSLIIENKYSDIGSWKTIFWTSRWLRLWPIFAIVCVLEFIISFSGGINPTQGTWSNFLFAFSHVFFIGLEANSLMQMSETGLYIKDSLSDHIQGSIPLFYTPVRQGWTLGIEALFYLFAPFILLKSTGFILLLFLGSLSFFAMGMLIGVAFDPWLFRFFPSVLYLFLAGSLAQRAQPFFDRHLSTKAIRIVVTIAVLGVTVFYAKINEFILLNIGFLTLEINGMAYLLFISITIPILFNAYKKSKVDRFIGNLSYPLYICHMLIIGVLIDHQWLEIWESPMVNSLTYSFAAAILLYLTIDKPIDRWRESWVRSQIK